MPSKPWIILSITLALMVAILTAALIVQAQRNAPKEVIHNIRPPLVNAQCVSCNHAFLIGDNLRNQQAKFFKKIRCPRCGETTIAADYFEHFDRRGVQPKLPGKD